MWINPETKQVFTTHSEIRSAFQTVSFPTVLSDDDIASVGVMSVMQTDKPEFSRLTEKVVEIAPEISDGIWMQQWQIVPLTQEEQMSVASEIQAEITSETQKRLDNFAATRNYSVDSIAKYKDIPDDEINTLPEMEQVFVRKFRTECRYLALAVARTWAVLNIGLNEISTGKRPMPTGFADIEPLLPSLEWPID